MQNKNLETYYQPIVDLQTMETVGFEALNRPDASELLRNVDCFCRNLSLQHFKGRMCGEILRKDFLLFVNIHPNVLLDKSCHSGETLQLVRELDITPQQVVFK